MYGPGGVDYIPANDLLHLHPIEMGHWSQHGTAVVIWERARRPRPYDQIP